MSLNFWKGEKFYIFQVTILCKRFVLAKVNPWKESPIARLGRDNIFIVTVNCR